MYFNNFLHYTLEKSLKVIYCKSKHAVWKYKVSSNSKYISSRYTAKNINCSVRDQQYCETICTAQLPVHFPFKVPRVEGTNV